MISVFHFGTRRNGERENVGHRDPECEWLNKPIALQVTPNEVFKMRGARICPTCW